VEEEFDRRWEGLEPVRLDEELLTAAGVVADREGLRALDAIHLAAALHLGPARSVFVTWDRRLAGAAGRLGLAVVARFDPLSGGRWLTPAARRGATIRSMCELLAVRSDAPFSLADLWPLAEGLERYGLAGYAWGAAWIGPGGALAVHRATCAFRDDPAREAVGCAETTAALIHLRRPSRFSWLGIADTQPFLDGAGRFAFAHNGELARHARFRAAYLAAGRIHGRADSEVGMRWLEDAWALERPAEDLLAALHETMGGSANLAALEAGGRAAMYAGSVENPVFGFRLGGLRCLSTGVYSIDRSLFRLVAPGARERRVVRPGQTARL
jgi:hypothetical protein